MTNARLPLVLLHGFLSSGRSWELVLPALERRHRVLAPTLPGHYGGRPLPDDDLVDAVERLLDEAEITTAHVAGSSLGGWLALRLAERGRARSVVAFAPAGGWAPGGESVRDLLELQRGQHRGTKAAAPHADALVATPQGRRRATELLTVRFEHIPADLLAHELVAAASAPAAEALIEEALSSVWTLDPARLDCPLRIVWGTADRLLPWPSAATRFRNQWLPHADWVILEDVGHAPQLDVPLEAAELILGVTRSPT